MAKISSSHEWIWQSLEKLAKTSSFMQFIQVNFRQMSENNEIVDKLTLCLIKTRILKISREQIQNKSVRMID